MAGRTVTLVLVDDGRVIGALPAFETAVPHWQETADLVDIACQRFGVDVWILRMLATSRPSAPGGDLTYLAEVRTPSTGRPQPAGSPVAGLQPCPTGIIDPLAPHPRRAAYAEPGGPEDSIDWARRELAMSGSDVSWTAAQIRTWNLSAIWRLDAATDLSKPAGRADDGGRPGSGISRCWLKQVPALFRHEPAVLAHLSAVIPGEVAGVLAHDDVTGRMLLADIPGSDGYGAGLGRCESLARLWHRAQTAAADVPIRATEPPFRPDRSTDSDDPATHVGGDADDLVALGVPDQRGAVLIPLLDELARNAGSGVTGLGALIDGLADRWRRIEECGLPDVLCHGDLHPGNARFDGGDRPTVLDLGDSFVGHPGFDILRLSGCLPDGEADRLRGLWAQWWRAAVPGCDPLAAIDLLAPVAALRHALVFARFLDAIEPDEWPYHAADVPFWLQEAVRLSGS